MSKLAFLKDIQVVAKEQPRKTTGPRKEWNPPSGLIIRLWKDGDVYPSQELVDKFDLNYHNRPTEEEVKALKAASQPIPFQGNGFDVADTEDFPTFQTGGHRFLIIAPVAKTELKVDLFGSVGYNDKNEPLISVMDQGAATFGKDFLIPAVEEIYGIVFAKPGKPEKPGYTTEDGKVMPYTPAVPAVEGVEYVDLVFVGQPDMEELTPWTLPEGKTVAFFPKKVSRGDKKGDMTVQRRENPQMYVLYPKSLMEDTPAEEATK